MIGWVIVLAVWITYIEVEHPNRVYEQTEETSDE
jgi:hypothetical protein